MNELTGVSMKMRLLQISLNVSKRLAMSYLALALMPFAALAEGQEFSLRWTAKDDVDASFSHVVDVVNLKTGAGLSTSDFTIFEDKELATSRFRMYLQVAAQVPLRDRSIRVWTDLKTGIAIQVEALVEGKPAIRSLATKLTRLSMVDRNRQQKQAMEIVRSIVRASADDPHIRSVTQSDQWSKGELVRFFRVSGKHGQHLIRISLPSLRVVEKSYQEFPQSENSRSVLSVPALVYPVFEEVKGVPQGRVISQLRHLKTHVTRVTDDPYSMLRLKRYFEEDLDPVLGLTPEGQAEGKWATADIKERASLIRSSLPLSENSFAQGLVLDGLYASVSIHPDAAKLPGLAFQPAISAQFRPNWIETTVGDVTKNEMIPGATLLGRPLKSFEDAYARPARRLADHDPAGYLNDGFDEIQVYWAIDVLMDRLQGMGFKDPELSTRPFHAFLYDPDIGMKNNAYYTDDTINFTTYSPDAVNYARDNSTIWHELGHGVMDRLMGDLITLNDSGGLSEGMADFLAALVIADVTKGQPFAGQDDFRIVNKTAFFLTNESHDDGEAYGGAMYDLLQAARAKYGAEGVRKIADLTIEAMRLCRNHPALTASDWFDHMFFADELGHAPVRSPGEISQLITQSLAGRNFAVDSVKAASFDVVYKDKAVGPFDDGSRAKPIRVSLASNEQAKFTLKVSAKESEAYRLQYPLTVKVGYRGGPLQGAVHWEGEENGDRSYVLKSPTDEVAVELNVAGKCDQVNRQDGSCVDFVYVQLMGKASDEKPIGKKRFYVRVKPQ